MSNNKELDIIKFSNITLGNKVMVSDPCYDIGTWCQIILENVKPGAYETYVVKKDEDYWGIRCDSLIVKHVDKEINSNIEFVIHQGEVGVDSGQAGIFDFSIYPEKPHTRTSEDIFYENCCNITLSKMSCGTLRNGKGIVSSSGYGDGGYTLIVSEDEHGQIDYMHILFIGPEFDEDDYETDKECEEACKSEIHNYVEKISSMI